jgi:dTDP-4-dehydrorhamnose reductase
VSAASAGRWLVLGAAGQLGSGLVARLGERGIPCVARGRDLDVSDPEALRSALAELRPAVVANAAAYTDVDGCERDVARAKAVNAEAPGTLASLCREAAVALVHVSTDYVFDGRVDAPLPETAEVAPLSEYGRSKLAGERAALAASPAFLVVRTSWLFGRGRNFIASVCRRAAELRRTPGQGPLRVVEDQIGSPTYAEDLAAGLIELVERGARGLYHLANRGAASRFELARFALDAAGFSDLEIQPVKTVDFPLPAQRPHYTVLDCGRTAALGVRLRPWPEAVRAYLASDASPLAAPRGG